MGNAQPQCLKTTVSSKILPGISYLRKVCNPVGLRYITIMKNSLWYYYSMCDSGPALARPGPGVVARPGPGRGPVYHVTTGHIVARQGPGFGLSSLAGSWVYKGVTRLALSLSARVCCGERTVS